MRRRFLGLILFFLSALTASANTQLTLRTTTVSVAPKLRSRVSSELPKAETSTRRTSHRTGSSAAQGRVGTRGENREGTS